MNEKEYIERAALIAEYDRVHVGAPGGARKLMVDAPAADVAEVVHGHWEQTGHVSMRFCTRCQFPAFPSESEIWKYCPACGAKMDGKGQT